MTRWMFEWPWAPPLPSETIRDWRERQIFEWIFARKLVKVGFVIACPRDADRDATGLGIC